MNSACCLRPVQVRVTGIRAVLQIVCTGARRGEFHPGEYVLRSMKTNQRILLAASQGALSPPALRSCQFLSLSRSFAPSACLGQSHAEQTRSGSHGLSSRASSGPGTHRDLAHSRKGEPPTRHYNWRPRSPETIQQWGEHPTSRWANYVHNYRHITRGNLGIPPVALLRPALAWVALVRVVKWNAGACAPQGNSRPVETTEVP
jgi:hypothetical protein